MPSRHARGATLTFTVLLLDGGLTAAEPAHPPADRPAPPGDELALFADLPVVISATRQQTALNLSPVPVSVVGADAIHDGAATSLEGAITFVPGVDVLHVNRSTPAVGIHGFHGTFSDRMLTLINGRNADNLVYGGPEFSRLPILLADIDHIEVVRGPGGAVWGPNAFNGVINVITKEPEDMLGVFGSATATNYGDWYGHARWCESAGDWSWRTSVGGREVQSTRDALDDSSIPDTDWSRTAISDNEVVWRASPTTRLRGGVGYARGKGGALEIVAVQSAEEMDFWNLRGFLRADQQLGRDTKLQVQWYGNYQRFNLPTFAMTRNSENAVDAQLDLPAAAGHQLSLGAEARRIDIDFVDVGNPDQVGAVDDPYHEHRGGAYLVDSWTATPALTVEGQIRGDRYTGTGNDWAGRLAGLYALDANRHQVLRLAGARAYRTPLPAIRDGQASHPILGSPRVITLLPSDGLRNEHTWSAEIGYSNQLTDGLLLRWDTSYQRYEDLIGFKVTPQAAPPGLVAQAANIDGAYGVDSELELAWSGALGRISGWYAFNGFETDQHDQAIRAFAPARHKAGASLHVALDHGFAANADYKYSGSTQDSDAISVTRIPIAHRLDLNVAWSFARARGELMLGVEDVINTRNDDAQGTGSFTSHPTPGRTFFVRGEYGF
jgi:outer membrane receptor protein involved in Fe transport